MLYENSDHKAEETIDTAVCARKLLGPARLSDSDLQRDLDRLD